MYKTIVDGEGGMVVKVVAHSIANDIPIITYELTYPRFIHSELMTHRMFSRNASSSRAIPAIKLISSVWDNPAMPIHWGKNKAGMQADEELGDRMKYAAQEEWDKASSRACKSARALAVLGVHKQITNRILEPFQFMHTVVTATEWDNFFLLRTHKDAQPEIQELANLMKKAMLHSTPEELAVGQWHLPYVPKYDREGNPSYYDDVETAIKCSAARCARVSYMKHDNTAPSIEEDLDLYNMLAMRPCNVKGKEFGEHDPVHLSPLEHQATPMRMPYVPTALVPEWEKGLTHVSSDGRAWSGNFHGWLQHRQLIAVE
jgi:thymidylate synthase ThyX